MNWFSRVSSVFILVVSVSALQAQQLNLSRLFYPNATMRAEYHAPVSTPSGDDFGLMRTSFLGFVPLKTEVQAGFSLRKKLDVRAVHTLMYGYYSQASPELGGIKTPEDGFKTLSLGVIHLKASLKDRLWAYGGGVGISESNETFLSPQPQLWGGAARVHILGLQTQLMYGSIIAYNQKLMVIPVFGVNKRFNKNWRATALLPFTLSVRNNVNKWLNAEVIAGVNGYSSGFKVETIEEKLLRRQNYRHVKAGIAVNAHLASVFNVSLEAGLTGFRGNKTVNSARQTIETNTPGAAPYIGASIRYITTKSKLSSQFTRRMGIGESGLNW